MWLVFKQAISAFLLFFCFVFTAQAAQKTQQQPDLVSLGLGSFDIFHYKSLTADADIRLEHRWGYALYSTPQGAFQIHPFAGVEVTPRASIYGFGGFVFDWMMSDHWVLSPNLAAGLYSQGDGLDMAYPLEFRSTMEIGWRFDNNARLTAYFSHMSNANIARRNPGAEMAGLYLHVPF